MRKSFRPFRTDNDVVGPVVAENLIEKELESVARDIDVTVTNEGFRNIIVVHLGRDEIIDLTQFPEANIIEILPQEDQGGFFNGTLDFTPEGAKRRIEQGYEDTVRILKPIYEMGLVQKKYGMGLEEIYKNEMQFRSSRSKILLKRESLKNELDAIIERRKD